MCRCCTSSVRQRKQYGSRGIHVHTRRAKSAQIFLFFLHVSSCDCCFVNGCIKSLGSEDTLYGRVQRSCFSASERAQTKERKRKKQRVLPSKNRAYNELPPKHACTRAKNFSPCCRLQTRGTSLASAGHTLYMQATSDQVDVSWRRISRKRNSEVYIAATVSKNRAF